MLHAALHDCQTHITYFIRLQEEPIILQATNSVSFLYYLQANQYCEGR